MTAGLTEDVTLRMPRLRGWTWEDLQDIRVDGPGAPMVVVHDLDGDVDREVRTIPTGQAVRVDRPFRVEVRPAELVGPRRRG